MKHCHKCNQDKLPTDFYRNASRKSGLGVWCKECETEYRKKRYHKRKAAGTCDNIREKQCNTCSKVKRIEEFVPNFDKADGYNTECKTCCRDRLRTPEGKKRRMLYSAKPRAARKGIEFNLTPEDFTMPINCPILGIPLCFTHNTGGPKDDAPSLHRMDLTRGYVKNNVIVVSQRANRIMNDASLDELVTITKFLSNLKTTK